MARRKPLARAKREAGRRRPATARARRAAKEQRAAKRSAIHSRAAEQGVWGGRRSHPQVMTLRSYAKVNLGLEVLGLRDDGFHELRTLFQSIDLHDELVLRPRDQGIGVVCDHPLVPSDGTNLVARAAAELRRYAGVEHGVEIEIRKRLPVGGGLGGGSSNAAAVLLGLDRLWGLGLGPAGLHPLARRLGADEARRLLGGR